MKIQDAKDLLQNLLFTNKKNKLSRKIIMDKYPELVLKSREHNKDGVHVYRVLRLIEGTEIRDLRDSESTTTSAKSAFNIAEKMPSILMTDEGTKKLETHLLTVNAPAKNILLDIDVILPILKEKLKNNMNKNIVYNVFGDTLKIYEAFEEVDYAEEKEILVDLRKLKVDHLNLGNRGMFSFAANISHIQNGCKKIGYAEDLPEQYNLLKGRLSKKDENTILDYAKENGMSLAKEKKVVKKQSRQKNKI